MNTQERLQQAAELLQPWARWSKSPQPDMLTISLSRNDLLSAVDTLLKAKWGYLSSITGLHIPGMNVTSEEKQWDRIANAENIHFHPTEEADSFIVLYTFCSGAALLNLRIHPPSLQDNAIPSVCGLIPSATLFERELIEMFGIQITGTPNEDHLVLPDDWPGETYPLRKSFQGLAENEKGKTV